MEAWRQCASFQQSTGKREGSAFSDSSGQHPACSLHTSIMPFLLGGTNGDTTTSAFTLTRKSSKSELFSR